MQVWPLWFIAESKDASHSCRCLHHVWSWSSEASPHTLHSFLLQNRALLQLPLGWWREAEYHEARGGWVYLHFCQHRFHHAIPAVSRCIAISRLSQQQSTCMVPATCPVARWSLTCSVQSRLRLRSFLGMQFSLCFLSFQTALLSVTHRLYI